MVNLLLCSWQSLSFVTAGIFIHARIVARSIVTLRIIGQLKSGSVGEIAFSDIQQAFVGAGALVVLRNTAALTGAELALVQKEVADIAQLEDTVIREHIGQIPSPFADELSATKELMQLLSISKQEGETTSDFESRLVAHAQLFFGWK